MPKITPFLWFDTQAEEAAQFYTSVFPNSQVLEVVRYGEAGPGQAGSVMSVRFALDGNEFVALNGGPEYYGFSPAVSFYVDCKSSEEVDHYWAALTDGGKEDRCGWLQDRFGLSWQIVPEGLPALLADPDPERSQRAIQAMFTMTKLDIRAMERAAAGDDSAA
jgi:predicted 3-demethylubiquinone-9 3-methyltransferase (glyoxalase superfamily)